MKCPHCLVSFHDVWTVWYCRGAGGKSINGFADSKGTFRFKSTVCPTCKQLVFNIERLSFDEPHRHTELTAYPIGTTRPVPPEVEGEFASDFREASLVIGDSEKASAALSRRCLQNLLREKAEATANSLAAQIQEVLNSGNLPSHLANAIDGVRAIGNFAAHPIKSERTGEVIEVEPGEAEWLLETLEGLFDFYFVQPANLKKKRDALNKKLNEAGKPPLKN